MSDTNTSAPVAAIDIAGQKFELNLVQLPARKKKDGSAAAPVVYFEPVLNDAAVTKRFLSALVDGAERVKAGSSRDLVGNLLKSDYRQATTDATADGDEFLPVKYVESLVTTERSRAHGEKLSDMKQQLADLAEELLFLYELANKCGNNDAAIAKETNGEIKSFTALTQTRVAKTEKRRNIAKAIDEKEAKLAAAKAKRDANKAAEPAVAA